MIGKSYGKGFPHISSDSLLKCLLKENERKSEREREREKIRERKKIRERERERLVGSNGMIKPLVIPLSSEAGYP